MEDVWRFDSETNHIFHFDSDHWVFITIYFTHRIRTYFTLTYLDFSPYKLSKRTPVAKSMIYPLYQSPEWRGRRPPRRRWTGIRCCSCRPRRRRWPAAPGTRRGSWSPPHSHQTWFSAPSPDQHFFILLLSFLFLNQFVKIKKKKNPIKLSTVAAAQTIEYFYYWRHNL